MAINLHRIFCSFDCIEPNPKFVIYLNQKVLGKLMILKELVLRNIRSYSSAKIQFPMGTILLSGDVGAGKSTVLLAIEFALFGTMRGLLGGESLLRRGANSGKVVLTFDIDGKEYVVERNLKRSQDRVSQESGYIVADEMKFIGTATELKSKMLSILAYPEDIMNKKSLIFRYTVYTPQEQMKQIILEDQEGRLDTLRRIFNIDKYKMIRENVSLYCKHIREAGLTLAGAIALLPEKEKKVIEKIERLNNLKATVEIKKQVVQESKLRVDQKKLEVEEQRKLNERRRQIEADIKSIASQKSALVAHFSDLKNRIENMTKNLEQFAKEKFELSMPSEKPEVAEKVAQECSQRLLGLKAKISEKDVLVRKHKSEIGQVEALGSCSLCKQIVSGEHKAQIAEANNKHISELETEKIELEKQFSLTQEEYVKSSQKMKVLNDEWKKYELMAQRKKNTEDQMKRLVTQKEDAEKQIAAVKLSIGNNNQAEQKLHEEEKGLKPDSLNEIMKVFEQTHAEFQILEKELFGLEREIKMEEAGLSEIKVEVENLGKKKTEFEKIESRREWLTDKASPVFQTMEKHVFMQVYHEFNSLFRKWLSMLITDQIFDFQLNDEFAPVVIQNGYEIPLEDLSGGEKTALALAYRLSLNKVVNQVVSEIKTKDLLILDEPTDGFSSDQLNTVREILQELGLRQVIIVSHEPKIEHFVDHIIRIEKRNHESVT